MIRVVKWKELFTRTEVEEIVADILTELQSEIEEQIEDTETYSDYNAGLRQSSKLIQQKINALKGDSND